MKKALSLTALASLFLISFAISQAPCGFDQVQARLMKQNPAYARGAREADEAIRRYVQSHPMPNRPAGQHRLTSLYTIPVVVHVMHTGGAVGTTYNPSDAQIQGAIDYLNNVYAGTLAGMTAPIEGGGVVDMEIQFGLAQRTPACGATNGIDRVNMAGDAAYVANGVNLDQSTGIDEVSLKNVSRWNTANYYNIWIVNKIDGADGTSGQFTAGFAYFPQGSPLTDGTIMLATQMQAGRKTLPHEIGHALALHHPFNGSNDVSQCPTTGTCGSAGVDDQVCDTKPIPNNVTGGVYSFACRTGLPNSCDGNNPFTINTENNYMSYTNCYTLFTNGQKVRAQGALSLSSRASLVSPSNLALTPCETSVNFSLASTGASEDEGGTLTGCRRYRDYTYQLRIGGVPSAVATATLTYSGTAIRGIDYDVTTNGNFASPSNTITFNTGSQAAQNFVIRIYDDGEVESPETAVLDFTFNNGGGNATKGTTTPTLTFSIGDNDTAPAGSIAITTPVGSPAFTSGSAPFDARQSANRAQILYRASELTGAGMSAANITVFQLSITQKNSSRPFTNLTIKMGLTGIANLAQNPSLTPISGLTTVYTNPSYSTTLGWNSFTLTTPFAWDGTSNVVIEFCYDNSTADAGNAADVMSLYSDGGSATQGNFFWQNSINCSGSFSSVGLFYNGIKPIARFSIAGPGTPIETIATSTINQHIEAGSNDFFYSNNDRLLMRLSNISAPLGCVTSTVENAGTAWTSYSGGERSAKVFAVTPTTNTATANYTIALYFDNAELGGKNPATLRLAKTTAASAAAATSANTVIVTPTVTTLGPNTTIFTANFTGFSRFFLIDAAVTLPVELISFTGKVNEQQQTALNWITASEFDNREFDVEASTDGASFISLATIPSQGNAASEQYYQYIHLNPSTGTTWYRLKQVDIDGRFTYSNVITVTINSGKFNPTLYPVPAGNTITINFNTLVKKADIEMYSADMKSIKRERINGPLLRKDFSLNGLPSGVYFIRISGENGTRLLRFVKQ